MEEHVWFYGRLKGVSAAALGPEQEHLIQDVGLIPKRDTQTRHLSGERAFRGPLHGGEGCRTSGADGALVYTQLGKACHSLLLL